MAEPPAYLDAAEFRQHQVQDQQVRILVQSGIQPSSSVVRHADRIAFVLQLQLQEPGDFLFIFNDENMGHSFLLLTFLPDPSIAQKRGKSQVFPRSAGSVPFVFYSIVAEWYPSCSSSIVIFPSLLSTWTGICRVGTWAAEAL